MNCENEIKELKKVLKEIYKHSIGLVKKNKELEEAFAVFAKDISYIKKDFKKIKDKIHETK